MMPPVGPAVPAAMVDKLCLRLAVLPVEKSRLGLVELIENPPAVRNPGKRIAGPGHAYQGSASRKAKYSGQKQSSIHENLPIASTGNVSADIRLQRCRIRNSNGRIWFPIPSSCAFPAPAI
jgi:hypothetical protein